MLLMKESVLRLTEKNNPVQHWFAYFQFACKY